MLQLLHIENIAVIERADIWFRAGFNALTGETGAGKSIVIDSLSAVLGQRTSRELIRTGADHAFVSAVFSHIPEGLGEDLGVADAQEWLLQREIYTDGKNVCRVNGRPVSVAALKKLGARLINIHGHTFGQKQVVAAQRNDLCDLALKVYGAFLDKHGADLGGGGGGQVHGGELIHIAAALDAAPVDGTDKALGGQVHNELAALLN